MNGHRQNRSPAVATIATPQLGDRSYVISSGTSAAVVDPQRDIDRVLSVLDDLGVSLTHILETHVHNDYVSGGLELARETGAEYGVAAAEDVHFERRPLHPGEVITLDGSTLTVTPTAGHTPHHLSYVLSTEGEPSAVFTGGSLLYGTVGRTDLISPDRAEELARAQYRSTRRLLADLPAEVAVYPTHGFGSFCASTACNIVNVSTIGAERIGNVVMAHDDEEEFVTAVLAGLTAYPRYYAHMGPINRAGPASIDLSPRRDVTAEELRERIDAGEWVVDVRSRRAFAAGHLHGTVGVELSGSFASYLGWTIPWGTPVTLVGDTPDQLARAQRDLARIGIDDPSGQATSVEIPDDERSSYRVAGFADLAAVIEDADVEVIDVRREDEYRDGHIKGSRHIHLPDLEARLDELPDAELWVHCTVGFRASIAASLLDRAGKRVVLVDDDFAHAREAGLIADQ